MWRGDEGLIIGFKLDESEIVYVWIDGSSRGSLVSRIGNFVFYPLLILVFYPLLILV